MHLGNIFAALISWLSIKQQGGRWILRIEDLDPQRSRLKYARRIEDDLDWLGLDWDEGGIDGKGPDGPYCQSLRSDIYAAEMNKLEAAGLTYPCFCTRADIMATQAPHESDGRIVYAGTCRPPRLGGHMGSEDTDAVGDTREKSPRAIRLFVPDKTISFSDRHYGRQEVNLARHCGDFVVRRGDGAWAYQLAVVADDARMGVTEVVRGCDLLLSSAQQIYLYGLLGYRVPEFAHFPLLCNKAGQRLSKRDLSLGMDQLRKDYDARHLIGLLACHAGILPEPSPVSPRDLLPVFSWTSLPEGKIIPTF